MTRTSNKSLLNFLVLMYFLFMLLTTQLGSYFVFLGYYATLILCSFLGVYLSNPRIKIKVIMLAIVFAITALINSFFVGNCSIKDILYMICFSFASLALVNERVEEKTLLLAIGLNAAVVMFKFATVGIQGQLYTNASSNFVSVYLMYPATVYYAVAARRSNKVNIIPAVVIWILSLYARGRGGILSTTFFLVCLLMLKYSSLRSIKKLLVSTLLVLVVAAVSINLPKLLDMLGASVIMEFFKKNGLRSSRTWFWPEYTKLATENISNFMFGANISNTFIGMDLKGNPHNSFMEIHILNGIIPLAMVVVILVKNGIISIKKHNYLYLIAMLSMMLRAFTDHVLWAAFGTPVLFFFMLYYDVPYLKRLKQDSSYSYSLQWDTNN